MQVGLVVSSREAGGRPGPVPISPRTGRIDFLKRISDKCSSVWLHLDSLTHVGPSPSLTFPPGLERQRASLSRLRWLLPQDASRWMFYLCSATDCTRGFTLRFHCRSLIYCLFRVKKNIIHTLHVAPDSLSVVISRYRWHFVRPLQLQLVRVTNAVYKSLSQWLLCTVLFSVIRFGWFLMWVFSLRWNTQTWKCLDDGTMQARGTKQDTELKSSVLFVGIYSIMTAAELCKTAVLQPCNWVLSNNH